MLLAEVISYVGANQGGLFLLEGESPDERLTLSACYAYGRKRHERRDFAPGDSLVRQCYLERDLIYLTEVPNGYTRITSGLGGATPSAILLVPLLTNERAEGVFEVATFQPFESHQLKFLRKLSADLAAAVGGQRTQELTRKLLSEAQESTEMLRAQEEEMRQNVEELSATQEEMQRKERSYVEQIEALRTELAAARTQISPSSTPQSAMRA